MHVFKYSGRGSERPAGWPTTTSCVPFFPCMMAIKLTLNCFFFIHHSITNVIRQILHSAELRKINGLRRITSLPIIANSRDNGNKKTSFLESSFFCFISLVGDIMSVGRKSGIFYVDLAKIHDSKRGWKTGSECTAEKSWK